MTILSILRPFDIWYDQLVYFVVIWDISPPFWYVGRRKIWQPWSGLTGSQFNQRNLSVITGAAMRWGYKRKKAVVATISAFRDRGFESHRGEFF
jgi:hypothetical protein